MKRLGLFFLMVGVVSQIVAMEEPASPSAPRTSPEVVAAAEELAPKAASVDAGDVAAKLQELAVADSAVKKDEGQEADDHVEDTEQAASGDNEEQK